MIEEELSVIGMEVSGSYNSKTKELELWFGDDERCVVIHITKDQVEELYEFVTLLTDETVTESSGCIFHDLDCECKKPKCDICRPVKR